MPESPYQRIVEHYEQCLARFGAGAKAVNWKSDRDAAIRYDVMLGVINDPHRPQTVLDVGCGLAGLRDHMEGHGLMHLDYVGIDVSPAFVTSARQRRPDLNLLVMDILDPSTSAPTADYVIMNGVFTRRDGLDEAAMLEYMRKFVARAFSLARTGLAFNVMSSFVDWKGEDLFHPALDAIAELAGALSRHWTLRNDYGLYETTCYIYRVANARA